MNKELHTKLVNNVDNIIENISREPDSYLKKHILNKCSEIKFILTDKTPKIETVVTFMSTLKNYPNSTTYRIKVVPFSIVTEEDWNNMFKILEENNSDINDIIILNLKELQSED